jgi:aminopeptidase N
MARTATRALVLLLTASAWSSCSDARDMSASDIPSALVPAPGVSLPLAQDRAGRLSDVRYDLQFTIPAAVERPVTGSVTVRFKLADASRPLALDFAGPAASIRDVRARGQAATPLVRDEHVIVPAAALVTGENELSLAFDSSDLALNRNPEFMYSLFVPARARLAFPCFDQPDIKARYSLVLEIPAGWEAVSNGTERARSGLGTAERITFNETKPISTYLFAFAAGRFSVEAAERSGRRFRMLHRETDPQKVARNRDTVFDLHAAALEWLERYTSIPYPYEKFDFLLVPAFQFGGMEHPGSIFYNAPSLLLDPSATQNQKLGRASLIAHETAHMWFGDLVTMKWFDDVWMKEVFANFMAAKIVNPTFPEIDHDLRFLYAHYPAAYDVDRTAGTNAIRQRLENLNEAGTLYGAIIYQKAPIVMRQLEMILSADGLRDGLRQYLKQHAFANASWPDLIGLLDGRTSEDLDAWSRAWVEEPGRPIVTSTVRKNEAALLIKLTQKDPAGERKLEWNQRLKLTVGLENNDRTIELPMKAPEVSVAIGHGFRPVRYVLPTGGGVGYGDFVLDGTTRQYLLEHLPEIKEGLTRGAAVVTLWEEVLGERVTPRALFELLTRAVPREADELNVGRMLTYLTRLFWKFLPPEEREARASTLEAMMSAGLGAARTPSLKSAWFNALRDVARTPATIEWLEKVWNKSETVQGLTLAEPDYIVLALELAVRDVPTWKAILEQEQTRIQNPDRKAQFAFVAPALSADEPTRAAFFERLRDVKNRGREAWVLQGLNYLHHPLRASASEAYIPASLELVQEIQRTGDIFFPKRWVDATLSGHQSVSAAATVRSFLERIPEGYPERLRRNIVASADDLFRASRILNR